MDSWHKVAFFGVNELRALSLQLAAVLDPQALPAGAPRIRSPGVRAQTLLTRLATNGV